MEDKGYVKALTRKFENGEITTAARGRINYGRVLPTSTTTTTTIRKSSTDNKNTSFKSYLTGEVSSITRLSSEVEECRKTLLDEFDTEVANMRRDQFLNEGEAEVESINKFKINDKPDVMYLNIGFGLNNIDSYNNINTELTIKQNLNDNENKSKHDNVLEKRIDLGFENDVFPIENDSEETIYEHIYEDSPILIEDDDFQFVYPGLVATSGSQSIETQGKNNTINDSTGLTPERRLNYIANEIETTEITYFEELTKLVMLYKPYIEKNVPQDKKHVVQYLFGNIYDIYLSQLRLLNDIQSSGGNIEKVLHCFIDHAKLFELYPKYLINRRKAEGVLKEFQSVLKELQEYYKFTVDFTAYLLLPLNRLSKYVLFLKDILKQLKKLKRPVEVCQVALDIVETQMCNGNDGIAIDSIKNSPLDRTEYGSFKQREKFTIANKNKKEAFVFLFENVVVFTTADPYEWEMFKYESSIYMKNVSMDSVKDLTITLKDFEKSKSCKDTKEFTYILETKSIDVWNLWKRDLEIMLWEQLSHAKATTPTLRSSKSMKFTDVNTIRAFSDIKIDKDEARQLEDYNPEMILGSPIDKAELGHFKSKSKFLLIKPVNQYVVVILFQNYVIFTFEDSTNADFNHYYNSIKITNLLMSYDDDNKIQLIDCAKSKDNVLSSNYIYVIQALNESTWELWKTMLDDLLSDRFDYNEVETSAKPLPIPRTTDKNNESQEKIDDKTELVVPPLPTPRMKDNRVSFEVKTVDIADPVPPPLPPRMTDKTTYGQEKPEYMVPMPVTNLPLITPRVYNENEQINEVPVTVMNLPPLPPRVYKGNEEINEVPSLSRSSVIYSQNYENSLCPIQNEETVGSLFPFTPSSTPHYENNLNSKENEVDDYGYLENLTPRVSKMEEKRTSLKEINHIDTDEMEEVEYKKVSLIDEENLLAKKNEFEICQLITNSPINNIDLGPFQKKEVFTILEPIESEGMLFLFKHKLVITTVNCTGQNVQYYNSIDIMNLNVTFLRDDKICLQDFSEYINLDKDAEISCVVKAKTTEIWEEWKNVLENVTLTRSEGRTGTLKKPPIPVPRGTNAVHDTENDNYEDLNTEEVYEEGSDDREASPELPPRKNNITPENKLEMPPALPIKSKLVRSQTTVTSINQNSAKLNNGKMNRHLSLEFGNLIQNSPINIKHYGDFQMMDKFKIKKPFKMECYVFLFKDIIIFTFNEEMSSQSTFFINDRKEPYYCYYDCIYTKDVRVCCLDEHTLELTDFTKINQTKNIAKYTFILESKRKGTIQKWNSAIEDILWYEWKITKERALLNRSNTSAFTSSFKKVKPVDIQTQVKAYSNEQIQSIKYSGLKKQEYGLFKMKSSFHIMEPVEAQALVFLFENVIVFTVRDEDSPGIFHSLGSIKLDCLHIEDSETNLLVLTDSQKGKKKREVGTKCFVLKADTLLTWQTWKVHLRKMINK